MIGVNIQEPPKHSFERRSKQRRSAKHTAKAEPQELKEEAEESGAWNTKAFQSHSKESDLRFGTQGKSWTCGGFWG